MCCSKVCCAWCWIFYFFFALIFLGVLAILCVQDSYLTLVKENIRTDTALPVLIALIIYAVAALISVCYLIARRRKQKSLPKKSAFDDRRERVAAQAVVREAQPEPATGNIRLAQSWRGGEDELLGRSVSAAQIPRAESLLRNN